MMAPPTDRFGVFQDAEVLAVLDDNHSSFQLVLYSVWFVIVLLLNMSMFLRNRKSGRDRPIVYFKAIHIGLLLMMVNDMFIAVSRYQSGGEYIFLGNDKAILYMTGFNIFAIAWTLKVSHFLKLSKNRQIIINNTLVLYGIFALWGSAVMILMFVGILEPDTGFLGLGARGGFVAALMATFILIFDIILMGYVMIKEWGHSKYTSYYAMVQFVSLVIVLILLNVRAYGVSIIDRTKDPHQYIIVEYIVVPILAAFIPISLMLLQIFLFQPDWFNRRIQKSTS